ncbi:MAG: cysteine desulfurase / selenocysteine lyase [Patescibacteria group bacterium]|nr:cysteine desulfurase / selenocysteine lyase [Patescibacteria group bacterium]
MHREDFQIFNNYKSLHKSDLIYIDNTASSLTPDFVIEKMNEYYYLYKSNIDRGLYKSAERATKEYEDSRAKVADFIGAKKDEIIFTSGSTDSSNKSIMMFERYYKKNIEELKSKDEIVLVEESHHSELVPLQEFAKRNNLKIVLGLENLGDKTLLLSCPLASNVTGQIFDVKSIFNKAKSHKIITFCDMTAAAGHIDINVKDIDCDISYFGAHKMCGPSGVGVLYIKHELLNQFEPTSWGGGMVWDVNKDNTSYRSDNRRFEPGTPNIAGVIGLGYAIDYINNITIEKIRNQIEEVTVYALEKISDLEKENKIKVFAEKEINNNIGIISFEVDGVHAHDVAQILADNDIAVRSGHHCAQLFMKKNCVSALTRISLYFYNTKKDVDVFVKGLQKVLDKFQK